MWSFCNGQDKSGGLFLLPTTKILFSRKKNLKNISGCTVAGLSLKRNRSNYVNKSRHVQMSPRKGQVMKCKVFITLNTSLLAAELFRVHRANSKVSHNPRSSLCIHYLHPAEPWLRVPARYLTVEEFVRICTTGSNPVPLSANFLAPAYEAGKL